MATFHLNTPEAQSAKQAFMAGANEKRTVAKQTSRSARFARVAEKTNASSSESTRKLFTGAGK